MADLTIKVSEEKVRETIDTLSRKIDNMSDHLSQLIANREKLEKVYTGATATIGINAIKKREKEAATSIDKYKKQRDKLQEYLDSMNEIDRKVSSDYEEAFRKSNELFGE